MSTGKRFFFDYSLITIITILQDISAAVFGMSLPRFLFCTSQYFHTPLPRISVYTVFLPYQDVLLCHKPTCRTSSFSTAKPFPPLVFGTPRLHCLFIFLYFSSPAVYISTHCTFVYQTARSCHKPTCRTSSFSTAKPFSPLVFSISHLHCLFIFPYFSSPAVYISTHCTYVYQTARSP